MRSIRPSTQYYGRVFARYELREQVRQFFNRFDLLLTPTTPTAAFDIGRDVPIELDGENIVAWVAYTYPINLVRPAGCVDSLRLHPRRSAGRPAPRFESHARDRYFPRGCGLRGGAALGRPQAAGHPGCAADRAGRTATTAMP